MANLASVKGAPVLGMYNLVERVSTSKPFTLGDKINIPLVCLIGRTLRLTQLI